MKRSSTVTLKFNIISVLYTMYHTWSDTQKSPQIERDLLPTYPQNIYIFGFLVEN